MLSGPYEVLGELKGAEMEGWTYDGPFDELPAEQEVGGHTDLKELLASVKLTAVQAHQVILWDEVGETEGTGIVHIAPGCGAEDFQLGQRTSSAAGRSAGRGRPFRRRLRLADGMHVSEIAEPIFENLKQKGLLYHVEPYTHRYPTCWRCKTELVFRLVDEWFISMGEIYDKPREALTPKRKSAACATRSWMWSTRSAGSPSLATHARWTGCAICTIG